MKEIHHVHDTTMNGTASCCTCLNQYDTCGHCRAAMRECAGQPATAAAPVKPKRPPSKPYRPKHPRDAAPTPGDCLLTAPQVAARLGIGVRTLWRMVEQNKLPQPIRYTRKLVRWHSAALQAYLDGLLQQTTLASDAVALCTV